MKPSIKSAIAAVVAGTSVFAVLRWLRANRTANETAEEDGDGVNERIDEADLESFPASDPPSWTLGDIDRD